MSRSRSRARQRQYRLEDALRLAITRAREIDANAAKSGPVIAGNGELWHLLAPPECLEVTEYLLKECRAAACPLDLRLQQKSFQSFLQWEADWSTCHWHDLIAASVREATHHFRHEPNLMSPEAKKSQRRSLLREIIRETSDKKDQERRYIDRTGASRADYFRRKREVETGDFDEHDAA